MPLNARCNNSRLGVDFRVQSIGVEMLISWLGRTHSCLTIEVWIEARGRRRVFTHTSAAVSPIKYCSSGVVPGRSHTDTALCSRMTVSFARQKQRAYLCRPFARCRRLDTHFRSRSVNDFYRGPEGYVHSKRGRNTYHLNDHRRNILKISIHHSVEPPVSQRTPNNTIQPMIVFPSRSDMTAVIYNIAV